MIFKAIHPSFLQDVVPVSFYPNKRKMVGNWTCTVLKQVCEKTWEKQILLEYEMQQAAQVATETLLLKATQQCYTGRISGIITRSTR